MIYYLSKHFHNEFIVSITSLKCYLIQHNVHLVNYGPIHFKIDDKAGDALGPVSQDRGLATVFRDWAQQ